MSGNQGNSASQTGGDQVAFDGQTTVTLIIQTLLQAGMTPQEIAAAFETAFTTHLNTNIVPLFPTCHVLLIQLQGQIAALRTQVEILQAANTSLQNRFVARGDRLMVLLSQMQDLRAQVAAATAAGWVPVVGNGGDEESFDEEEMDEDDETDEDDGTDNPHQTDNGDGMDRENGMDGGNETDGEDEMEENGGARLNGN